MWFLEEFLRLLTSLFWNQKFQSVIFRDLMLRHPGLGLACYSGQTCGITLTLRKLYSNQHPFMRLLVLIYFTFKLAEKDPTISPILRFCSFCLDYCKIFIYKSQCKELKLHSGKFTLWIESVVNINVQLIRLLFLHRPWSVSTMEEVWAYLEKSLLNGQQYASSVSLTGCTGLHTCRYIGCFIHPCLSV